MCCHKRTLSGDDLDRKRGKNMYIVDPNTTRSKNLTFLDTQDEHSDL